MTTRVLEVAVGGMQVADLLARTIAGRVSQLGVDGPNAPSVRVHHVAETDEEISAANHLVVSTDGGLSPWCDVSIASESEAKQLTEDRLVPWVSRWREGRRAPRAQIAVLSEPDPSWAPTAQRLIARLRMHLTDLGVLRIDHIGSTSVEGLAAKNLIDIQVMIQSEDIALSVAEAATGAGFVHVSAQCHGKDRNGALHPEQICVDADPGRPVNISIRSADRPVGRDALLFRDWLRSNPDARTRYLAMKLNLTGRHVDDYGDNKEPFISAALHEADIWASETGWSL